MKRCQIGDLVLVISAHPEWSGMLGKVLVVKGECADDPSEWTFDPPWMWRGYELTAPDHCLRPIRPNDGQDETLTWAGLPNKETA